MNNKNPVLPRPAEIKITKYGSIVDIWHPINGKWVNLVQEIKGNELKYYINGKESAKPKQKKIEGKT